jgi:hypothetical protein
VAAAPREWTNWRRRSIGKSPEDGVTRLLCGTISSISERERVTRFCEPADGASMAHQPERVIAFPEIL